MKKRVSKDKGRGTLATSVAVALPDRGLHRMTVPRRGRPSADNAAAIDHRILSTATHCFFARGYDATTMDAVAARGRVSKTTLYNRFPDKESLLRAVVDERIKAWGEASQRQNWRMGATLEQRLKHYMTIVMTWASNEDVRAFDKLLATAPPHIAAPLYERRAAGIIDRLAGEIEQFCGSEGVPARDARQVAMDLMAMAVGWYQMESKVRPVPTSKAVAFGCHAVERLLAARASW